MLPLLHSELFRLLRRWMPRVVLLVVGGGVVLVYALVWVSLAAQDGADEAEIRDDLALAQAHSFGLDLTYFFASIVAVIMAASIVGTEFGWGTIRTLLPRARSRVGLLAAKLVALVVFDVVLIVVGFLAALAMSALVTAAENLEGDAAGDVILDAVVAIGRTTYVLLPYTALAFFVAVLTRSNAAGIAIGLAVLLAEGIVVAILDAVLESLDWVGDLLFSQNISAITDLNDGTRNTDLPDPWRAALVLALWVIAFVAVAVVVFRRRDVTSGA
jgi:ABC-2 type transport system permease protein